MLGLRCGVRSGAVPWAGSDSTLFGAEAQLSSEGAGRGRLHLSLPALAAWSCLAEQLVFLLPPHCKHGPSRGARPCVTTAPGREPCLTLGLKAPSPGRHQCPQLSQVLVVCSLGRNLFSPGETKPTAVQLCVVLIVFYCHTALGCARSPHPHPYHMDWKGGLFCGLELVV